MSASTLLRALALPLLIAIAWQLVSQQSVEYAFAFVPLQDVWRSFLEVLASGELLVNLLASVLTAGKGLLIGSATGIAVALLMGLSRTVDTLLRPLLNALRHIPTVALIPLIVLWFGNTGFSKVLVVSLAVFEVMVLNTCEGLHSIDRRFLEVGRALTLSRLAVFRYLRIPAALPSICTGFQHAIAFAWLATVAVELLFFGGAGLGSFMERGQIAARMDIVIVCLILIAILGFLIQRLTMRLSRRLLYWQGGR